MKRKLKLFMLIFRNARTRRYLIVCSSVTALIVIGQLLLVGSIYSEAKAIDLIKGFQSSSLYFGSSIATASVTVLALMLTLLSMARDAKTSFDESIYRGIEIIGFISTITFVGAVLLLSCLSLPIGEFDNIPAGWFEILYYVLSTLHGCLAGLMITGVMILFDTIHTLIRKLSL